MKKILPYFFITLTVALFFWQFFLKGLLPIPSDTIISLYHPFRDFYYKNYPNGIPFKNFLITDPVRQQYPWRELVISVEKKLQLPLWNPYSFSGTPLLANLQSAPFYPFNIILFLLPLPISWSLHIFSASLMSFLFLFLYLNNLKINRWASFLGALAFSFSGFFIVWLEWGVMPHTALWLPLILLSIDKMFTNFGSLKISNYKLQIQNKLPKNKNLLIWSLIYVFSLVSSLLGGHPQIFIYVLIFTWIYFMVRWFKLERNKKIFFSFITLNALSIILTSIQWMPALQFISLSARSIDVVGPDTPGWFIPWQHLAQFIAPDFFGNPTTLNYWGTWNYAELVGYVGIVPLIMAFFAMFYRRDRKTLFFGTIFFLSLFLSLPTSLAKIPFVFEIPFLNTAQPTRLLFVTDFSLAILSALGFDYLLKVKKRIVFTYPLAFISFALISLWLFIPKEHISVSRSNLLLPTILFVISSILFFILIILQKRLNMVKLLCLAFILVTIFDLLRFGWKFTPFTQKTYLFPSTETTAFLQNKTNNYRIMTSDSRILSPNFSVFYRLQSVDGYDPLYLLRYGELVAASERGKADITPPFGFNRIITPHNYDSRIIDLLGVKYVLSLSAIDSSKLTRVFQEGQTIVYENKNVMPRAFFVSNIRTSGGKKDSIENLFDPSLNLLQTAIVEGAKTLQNTWSLGSVKVINYSENNVTLNTINNGEGFLVLTDIYYPTWKVAIDGKQAKIYLTDYTFRGVVIPPGEHKVYFYNTLF